MSVLKMFWAFPIVLVSLVLQVLLGAIPSFFIGIFSRKRADDYVYVFNRLFANTVLFLCGAKANVIGMAEILPTLEGKPVCYVANHTSMLDILAVVGVLKVKCGYICKNILKYVPLFNLSEIAMHCVFLDRKNLRKSVEAIDRGTENIKKGISMLIFPEGTRSKTGEINPFKPGSFRMATSSRATIIPITIKGLRDSLEGRKSIFQTKDYYLHVGEPVDTSEIKDRQQQSDLVKQVENSIREVYSHLGGGK